MLSVYLYQENNDFQIFFLNFYAQLTPINLRYLNLI